MNLANLQLDQQKKILIVIFCVLIVYVDLNYILKAQRAGVNSLDSKVMRLSNDLASLNRNLENMRISKNKQSLGAQKTISKSTKIISEGEISGFLQDISKEANNFNIKIIQMRPSRQVQAGKKSAVEDRLIPFLINLDLICDYHSLGKFINALEDSLIFVRVNELKISTQATDLMKQKVNLVLKTYVTK